MVIFNSGAPNPLVPQIEKVPGPLTAFRLRVILPDQSLAVSSSVPNPRKGNWEFSVEGSTQTGVPVAPRKLVKAPPGETPAAADPIEKTASPGVNS